MVKVHNPQLAPPVLNPELDIPTLLLYTAMLCTLHYCSHCTSTNAQLHSVPGSGPSLNNRRFRMVPESWCLSVFVSLRVSQSLTARPDYVRAVTTASVLYLLIAIHCYSLLHLAGARAAKGAWHLHATTLGLSVQKPDLQSSQESSTWMWMAWIVEPAKEGFQSLSNYPYHHTCDYYI